MGKETLLLALAAVACYILLRRMGKDKKDESRAAKLMKKYATLTEENLASTPDEELVEAVVANVLSRAADSRRPDPAAELAVMPQPFTVVYSIWTVCKELARGDYKALTRTATREMVEPAIDGLPVIGASATAAALTALRAAYADKADTDAAEKAFHVAVEQECPLTLCAAYIRDHIPQLLGVDEDEDEVLGLVEETVDEA